MIDEGGSYRSEQDFLEEADLDCVGGWLWVAAAIGIGIVLLFIAAFVGGVWVVLRVMRMAKRQREAEQASAPGRPDLSVVTDA